MFLKQKEINSLEETSFHDNSFQWFQEMVERTRRNYFFRLNIYLHWSGSEAYLFGARIRMSIIVGMSSSKSLSIKKHLICIITRRNRLIIQYEVLLWSSFLYIFVFGIIMFRSFSNALFKFKFHYRWFFLFCVQVFQRPQKLASNFYHVKMHL